MIKDFRYGLRMLVKSPAFTAIAVLSLALGIGANTAIFSLVNVVLLRPIPVRDASGLASVFMTDQRNPGNLPISHLNYKDLRDQNEVFSEMAALSFAQVNWSRGEAAEQIPVQVVSGNYFSLLGPQMSRGRAFHPDEDRKATPVAVISHGFWERSLGSDPEIVGRTITLNRVPFTVIGITAKGFTGTLLGGDPSVWLPMSMHDVAQPGFDWYEQRRGLFLFTFGRLKPGVTIEQASANMRTIFASLEQAFPVDNKGRSAGAVSLLDARLNPQGARGRARGAALHNPDGGRRDRPAHRLRQHRQPPARARNEAPPGDRDPAGAGREPIAPGAAAPHREPAPVDRRRRIGAAPRLLDARPPRGRRTGSASPRRTTTLSIDRRVLLFTTTLAIVTGVLFGLAPAIQASKPDVVPVLKNEIVPTAAGRGVKGFLALRQILVVAQIALSLVSLVAAGMFLREPHAIGADQHRLRDERRARHELQPRARGLHRGAR